MTEPGKPVARSRHRAGRSRSAKVRRSLILRPSVGPQITKTLSDRRAVGRCRRQSQGCRRHRRVRYWRPPKPLTLPDVCSGGHVGIVVPAVAGSAVGAKSTGRRSRMRRPPAARPNRRLVDDRRALPVALRRAFLLPVKCGAGACRRGLGQAIAADIGGNPGLRRRYVHVGTAVRHAEQDRGIAALLAAPRHPALDEATRR